MVNVKDLKVGDRVRVTMYAGGSLDTTALVVSLKDDLATVYDDRGNSYSLDDYDVFELVTPEHEAPPCDALPCEAAERTNVKDLRVGDRVRVTRLDGAACDRVGTVTRTTGMAAYLLLCIDAGDEFVVTRYGTPCEALPCEAAPAPEQMNAAGNRANGGKAKWTLMLRRMWPALREVVRVTEMGAKKYVVDGWWNNELDEDETADAAIRHILAVISDVYIDAKGDVYYGQNDPESELPHWAHAAWNVLAIGALRIKRGMPRSGGQS